MIPFYFLIVAPQRRQTQAADLMHGRLVEGDEIITTSGIYGTIVSMNEDTIQLEIASATVITIARRAVGRLVADFAQSSPAGEEG